MAMREGVCDRGDGVGTKAGPERDTTEQCARVRERGLALYLCKGNAPKTSKQRSLALVQPKPGWPTVRRDDCHSADLSRALSFLRDRKPIDRAGFTRGAPLTDRTVRAVGIAGGAHGGTQLHDRLVQCTGALTLDELAGFGPERSFGRSTPEGTLDAEES